MIAELVTSVLNHNSEDRSDTVVLENTVVEEIDREPAVRQMRHYASLSGLPFWCVAYGDDGPQIVAASGQGLAFIPNVHVSVFRDADGPKVVPLESGLTFYSLPLPTVQGLNAVALGWIRQRPDRRPDDLILAAVEAGWTKRRVDEWLVEQPYASEELIQKLLATTWSQANSESKEKQLREELVDVAEQIEQTYEEITLLHSLTGNLELTRSSDEVAELCLSRVRELTQAAGAAIWIQDHLGEFKFLKDGELPLDGRGLARLCNRCDRRDWSKPFVKNRLTGTPLEREIPDLHNFVLCSIGDPRQQFGWLIHCNSPREFGSVQASLLQSIARILGTHLRNRALFQQNENLYISFVQSMVSTIDAKDAYTRGHSERVALVGKLLAEQMGLTTTDSEDIHLSGLLHDIGKVGVDDRILRKETRLTDEEFDQIKKHPEIGCRILAGLANLEHVLPGVRHHHESFDGCGYPDRLTGEEIPMMARVLAVADSYDAMASDRPYRTGMPLEQLESIFRENKGPQWDPRVIDAYFAARVPIRKLWSAHRPSDLNSLSSPSVIGRSKLSLSK